MALDRQQLNDLKTTLVQERNRLVEELSKFASKNLKADDDFSPNFPDYGDDEDENAQEVAEYGTRLSLETTLEKELRDVEMTLTRIEEGRYGQCKYCGKDLDIARLMARPTSSSCVECKTNLKNGN